VEDQEEPVPPQAIVPAPVTVTPGGDGYALSRHTTIQVDPGATAVGRYLATLLRPATGLPLPVHIAADHEARPDQGISLRLAASPGLGREGYELAVTGTGVTIQAEHPAGLFYGVQTLRQLLPPAVESRAPRPGPWPVPAVRITDRPRFAYRGAMLDVARHFFPVHVVRRFIDQLAYYKLNHLHLHLTDDQGWRLEIEDWPDLTRISGRTAVGGDPGGAYSQEAYAAIVAYARERHITVVPEIDMPGHTNAALVAYRALAPDRVAPEPYTGMKVGFSSLVIDRELTYAFVAGVLREVAALTPGPYLHIGGDEAFATPPDDYARFLRRVQPMVAALGKTVMGWQEIATVPYAGDRVVQYWRPEPPGPYLRRAVAQGARVVLSPANRSYLDMVYGPGTAYQGTPLGLDWAGPVEVRDAYHWDPGSYLEGVPEESVLGVEAPLWSETVSTPEHLDYLIFPRLPAIAEVGWSRSRDWAGFRRRLAAHAPRWRAAGIVFHPSPQIPW